MSRTNWVDRSITNVIEVRMPRNVFVNQYRTNWFESLTTNVISVYATNRLTRFQTNHVEARLLREVDNAVLILRGKLSVSAREAVVKQRRSGR